MKGGRILGAVLQGLLVGLILLAALVNLLALTLDARVFRYENF